MYIYADKGFAPFSFRHELKMLTITLTRNFFLMYKAKVT